MDAKRIVYNRWLVFYRRLQLVGKALWYYWSLLCLHAANRRVIVSFYCDMDDLVKGRRSLARNLLTAAGVRVRFQLPVSNLVTLLRAGHAADLLEKDGSSQFNGNLQRIHSRLQKIIQPSCGIDHISTPLALELHTVFVCSAFAKLFQIHVEAAAARLLALSINNANTATVLIAFLNFCGYGKRSITESEIRNIFFPSFIVQAGGLQYVQVLPNKGEQPKLHEILDQRLIETREALDITQFNNHTDYLRSLYDSLALAAWSAAFQMLLKKTCEQNLLDQYDAMFLCAYNRISHNLATFGSIKYEP